MEPIKWDYGLHLEDFTFILKREMTSNEKASTTAIQFQVFYLQKKNQIKMPIRDSEK